MARAAWSMAPVVVMALLTACDPGQPEVTETSTDIDPGIVSPSPGASTSGPDGSDESDEPDEPDSSGTSGPPGEVTWTRISSGFAQLVATLVGPDGNLLVVEQRGTIRRLDGDTVFDIRDRVTSGGEQGLLDATLTPDGQRLIVHYSGDDGETTLSSFPVSGALADPADEEVLLTIDQPAKNHNGGSIVFGDDGWLYMALGDGGGANDEFGNGADPHDLLGSILRLDVDSDPGQALPAPGNPFLSGEHAGEGHPMVWAHGLRNPWRIATDGDRWFVADVGQNAVEEVSVLPAGPGPYDLGWPEWEGDVCRLEPCDDSTVQPVATLTHQDAGGQACSIIGGSVASRPAADAGDFFFTDLCDHRVWRLDSDTGETVLDSQLPDGVTALALDNDAAGRVIAVTAEGSVWRRERA